MKFLGEGENAGSLLSLEDFDSSIQSKNPSNHEKKVV